MIESAVGTLVMESALGTLVMEPVCRDSLVMEPVVGTLW